ncbi:proteasome subunit beta type-3-like protein [Euroglyphus maynei]|uniref:Proteasome subunit beta type-3-like protein n=1 Tax=Euroglyphus maynei TaxID=6958 RepID=A0A1Y3B530_EURMA|nr:proteasome subunit beta type-3-like protein [Euroglyphus maynei]
MEFEPNSTELASDWPYIAGLFALTAIFLSLFEIFKHMQYYNKPYLQKYIVRILWMVPIYALNSWLAMFFPRTSIYMDTLRECYEAFVIYSFMKYLFNFLQNDIDEYEILVDCKPSFPNNFPFCFLPPLPGGRKFIQLVRHAMIQYIVFRPITTFLALIFQIFGVYGEGNFSLNHFYIYLLIINNLSQMVAMYFLVMFYQNYKRELAPMRPLGKFLSIKASRHLTDERTDVADHFRQIGNRMKNIWPSSQQSNYTNIDVSTTAPLIPMQVRKNYGSSPEGFQKI